MIRRTRKDPANSTGELILPPDSSAVITATAEISSSTSPKSESPASARMVTRASSLFFALEGAVRVSRANRDFPAGTEISELSRMPVHVPGASSRERKIVAWAFPRFSTEITKSADSPGAMVCFLVSESIESLIP